MNRLFSKLGAFTIIEGIVSMVLLSLLLSISLMIAYNVYRSFPSSRKYVLESRAEFLLDSLAGSKVTEPVITAYGLYDVRLIVSDFYSFDRVKVIECTLSDSLGRSVVRSKLMLLDEN